MPYASAAGLEDVVVGETAISYVGGETGELILRGFAVGELVGHASYEEVAYLLVHGRLPTAMERDGYTSELRQRRRLSPSLERIVDALDPRTPPVDALRTLFSALGDGTVTYPPTEPQGLELIARAPTMVARFARRRAAAAPLAPRDDLGHVANYLWMLRGSPPSDAEARALEDYFILLADHGMNASTFALRTVLSTNSDFASAVAAAMGALKGPLHGGAPSRVTEMLDAIGSEADAERWVRAALDRRERLFGFGHRAYKVEDPRAELLRGIAEKVAAPDRFRLARTVEEVALAELHARRPDQRLYTNVEYYGALVLEAVGLPKELFTPTFALARTAGWTAQALEQAGHNRLIRPDMRYTGPRGLRWPATGGA